MSDLSGKTPLHTYDDTGDRKMITEIWAWVVEEAPGSEGIPATVLPDRHGIRIVPLMGADRDRVESYRNEAVSLRIALGRPVRLVRFTAREVVETLR